MYINKRLKFIIVTVIVIFFLLTIAVFQFNQNKNYNLAKQELTQNTNTWNLEDEYFLKVVKDLQEVNDFIPTVEYEIKKMEYLLNIERLKRRCLEYEMERISTNKWYIIDFCDNEENLEQFKLSKQVEIQQANNNEPKQVVF